MKYLITSETVKRMFSEIEYIEDAVIVVEPKFIRQYAKHGKTIYAKWLSLLIGNRVKVKRGDNFKYIITIGDIEMKMTWEEFNLYTYSLIFKYYTPKMHEYVNIHIEIMDRMINYIFRNGEVR